MRTDKTLVITLSGTRSTEEVARDLEARGLRSVQVLAEIGCVIGQAPEIAIPKLRAVSGVADVALDQPIQLDDPDTNTSW